MSKIFTALSKLSSLLPLGSSLLLAIMIKTGVLNIDPNILAKSTPPRL